MTDHRPEQAFCLTREDAQRAWDYLASMAAIDFAKPTDDWNIVREANAFVSREYHERWERNRWLLEGPR